MLEKQPDGIEILVDMAKTGKIEPWNIDIVDVTDKYLQQLVEMKSNNLKFTGRTLFFAAVLLRLKSDVLEGIDPLAVIDEIESDLCEEIDIDSDSVNTNNVISLEDALARRSSVRLNRQRVVTLNDLIKQLEFYEKIEKKRSLINAQERAQRRTRSYADFTPDDILEMAHEEYIEEGIDQLHNILLRLFETNEKVELSELNETGMDKISTYITLLFLSARSRIDLVQEEFYSDLYIVQGA
ncbi:MAG: segregation/condensation protein A [Candidatus Gastranaerophilales bacterium]|nr:segregation/condensation protein A [Candidatus Gastranaerophilales bacterium]